MGPRLLISMVLHGTDAHVLQLIRKLAAVHVHPGLSRSLTESCWMLHAQWEAGKRPVWDIGKGPCGVMDVKQLWEKGELLSTSV
jgi:hypothetical protein